MGAGAREPAGSRLRYLAGGCAGLRVDGCAGLRSLAGSCGCAGARGSGNVIWLVWLISWLVGAGAREPAGSRLRYPAGVVVRVRGVRVTLSGSWVNKLAGGCGCAGTCWF